MDRCETSTIRYIKVGIFIRGRTITKALLSVDPTNNECRPIPRSKLSPTHPTQCHRLMHFTSRNTPFLSHFVCLSVTYVIYPSPTRTRGYGPGTYFATPAQHYVIYLSFTQYWNVAGFTLGQLPLTLVNGGVILRSKGQG